MAVPKKRKSKSRGRQGRSHDALHAPSLSTCPNCQEPRMPHRVCAKCGWYNGREVLTIKD
ncbi:MAG: 50S ribosomal protein L32 [Magnetococcus sp. DMHC-1]|nr:50S ribosomal protein L32 [Magnetococcales bacterium]